MNREDLDKLYSDRENQYELERKSITQNKVLLGWLRLFTFLCIPLLGYILYPDWKLILLVSAPLFALFLFLVARFTDLQNKQKFVERIIQMNQSERKALYKDYTDFNSGSEFADPMHPYAIDMDLFHANGLFAFMNRTVTVSGKKMLGKYLLFGSHRSHDLNETIEDLKGRLDWRHRYLAGAAMDGTESEEAASNWLKFPVEKDSAMRLLRWILPIFSITSLVLWQMDKVTDFQFILLLLVPLGIIGSQLKNINKALFTASKAGDKWKSMRNRLRDIESEEFKALGLKELQAKLTESDKSTKVALNRIIQLNDLSDYRLNMLMGIVLNVFLAWDFWMRTLMMNWLRDYADKFDQWEDDLAELEVWICAANYAYNRDDLSYAQLGGKQISIKELGHPLLPVSEGVKNDFTSNEECAFTIITGPNMAGKSTFLRAVGVNLIMARCGFPVVASQFQMPDLTLYSSMRTSDDLASSSSYFFAELSRLRFIVDAIEKGEKVFIILDEILKGTNSVDKEKGSAAFLLKLNDLKAKGIIATHDLSLCQLAKDNTAFQNLYFDSIIENDELTFDYHIRSGVCQNMNASFLLKKMGLT